MPRGPTVRVMFEAGTAGMVADTRKATAAVREFGVITGGVHGQALKANAAIRAMEGNFQSNTRAVSIFLRETLHLGPALNAAFSVIGPLLFAKELFDVGKKINDLFAKVLFDVGKKINDFFKDL